MHNNYSRDDTSLRQFLNDAYQASPKDTKNFVHRDFLQRFFRASSNFADKRSLLEASLVYVKNEIKKTGDLSGSKKYIEAAYKIANALLLAHPSKDKQEKIRATIKEFDDFLKETHTPAPTPPTETEQLIPLFKVASKSLDPSLNLLGLFEWTRNTAGTPLHKIVETYMERVYAACPELNHPEYTSAVNLIAMLLAVKHENPAFKNMTFYSLFPPNSEVNLQQLNEMETAFLKLIHFNTSL